MTKLYRHLNTRLPPGTPFVRIGLDTLGVLSPSDRLPDDGALRGLSLADIPLEGATRKVRLTLARLNLADVERECPAEEVLHLAQTVLYTAKREKQPLGVYRPEVLTRIQNDFDLLQQLIQALEEDRLTIFLQPKIRLNNRQVVGFEALVRWPQEDGSFIAPGAFLPLAETSGLLNALDLQILRKTVAATQYLSSLGHALPISFNATWSDLCNPDYVGKLLSILDSGQVDPARLEIEITETQAMQGYHEVAPLLATLRERGMAVSIDDFGTGHSSLAYLATLPADTIKIDRSFVQELGSGSIGEHVTEIVIALGRRFGYTVVAEGIETEAQRAHLVNMGCAIGQGFLFARPMSVDDVVDWLDPTGQEQVRVDVANRVAYPVPEHQLQDKSQRDYFQAGIQTPPDRIYFSPIDLNEEWGRVVVPLQPTVRVSLQTGQDGRMPPGLLILNYNLASMLAALRQLNDDQVMLWSTGSRRPSRAPLP
ncbi:EAL domain-containing protein [Marinobacter lutaoensis]|uniref:EAL domain-containing protein n=1 Tax=Marinobacter lutaoensis TaxID=135739 RepID=UPI001C3DF51F|nr:EAL domain-containing protein [Marinobacter lutaoensis]